MNTKQDGQSDFDIALSRRKFETINRIFVDAADQDYLAARWAFNNGLALHFYSGAQQAIEKLSKAVLLTNEICTKKYNHNLEKLFNRMLNLENGSILSEELELPDGDFNWRDYMAQFTLFDWVQKMNWEGAPNNRYALNGIQLVGLDLAFFDELYCRIRKLLQRSSDRHDGEIWYYSYRDEKFQNAPVSWAIRGSHDNPRLERLYAYTVLEGNPGRSSGMFEVFKRANIAFFDDADFNEAFDMVYLIGGYVPHPNASLDTYKRQDIPRYLEETPDFMIEYSRWFQEHIKF